MFILKAVILAGGYGTRMGALCLEQPKPMIRICGKPILQHQIELFRREEISDFIIVTHYLSDAIKNYFADGSAFGVHIRYFEEPEPLGTAGALPLLDMEDDFVLCSGDLLMNFSLQRMVHFHRQKDAWITLLTHPNDHPYDSTTLRTDRNGTVLALLTKNEKTGYYPNLCNAGVQIVSPRVFNFLAFSGSADFDRDVILPCINTKRVFSYRSAEYVFDVGTVERLAKAEADLQSGIVEQSRFEYPHKAVFLDRDGTINRLNGYITDPMQLELMDGVAEAINIMHKKGYLVIVVTNQPVVARGDCTPERLNDIHDYLEFLLAKNGAFLDAIYCCPHHPDRGFPGENPDYKIPCTCRKPAPGMLLRAAEDFHIDLSVSYMAGDSPTDLIAAERSGCIPVAIGERRVPEGVLSFSSVLEFSKYISDAAEQS